MDESQTQETQERRKRGGQPGNHNAVKHGFFSQDIRMTSGEEIATMQQVMERLCSASELAPRTLDEWITDFFSLSLVSNRLAYRLSGLAPMEQPAGEVAIALKQVLQAVDPWRKARATPLPTAQGDPEHQIKDTYAN